MGLVRRKMMLGKDVTMVMFSSSPLPLCRSVAVCIATLKMGGQEECFLITVRLILQLLLSWELHKSQACESLEATIDWVTCARQRLYLSMRWHCSKTLYSDLLSFLRQSIPSLGLSDTRACLFLGTQEDSCFWNLMKGCIGQSPTEAEFHTCSSELSLSVCQFLHSLICDRIWAYGLKHIGFFPSRKHGDLFQLKALVHFYQCLILLSLKIQIFRGELNDHVSNMYGK